MDFDAWIEQLKPADFLVALLALLTAFAYLAVLARAHARARLLIALARECRLRRMRQEEIQRAWGFAPRLDHYRRLEQDLSARLSKEGLGS